MVNRTGLEQRRVLDQRRVQGFLRTPVIAHALPGVFAFPGGLPRRLPGLGPGFAERGGIGHHHPRGEMTRVVPDPVGIHEHEVLGRAGLQGQAQGLAHGRVTDAHHHIGSPARGDLRIAKQQVGVGKNRRPIHMGPAAHLGSGVGHHRPTRLLRQPRNGLAAAGIGCQGAANQEPPLPATRNRQQCLDFLG